MKRLILLALVLGLFFGATSPASAGSVVFNPFGTSPVGDIPDVAQFDWQVGNALAVEGNTSVAVFIATATPTVIPGVGTFFSGGVQVPFTTYFQTRLIGLLDSMANDVTPAGLNTTFEITLTAAFQEVVTSVFLPIAGGAEARFAFRSGGTNFFQVFQDTTPDSSFLAGTGFDDGSLILDATVRSGLSNFSRPAGAAGGGAGTNLDQVGIDNYPSTDTVNGSGSTQVSANVGFVDPAFFPGLLSALLLTTIETDTFQGLPFDTVNPSAAFDFTANPVIIGPQGSVGVMTAGAGFDGTPLAFSSTGIGTVNGELPIGPIGGTGGPSIQFETDANSTINQVAVPEPSTMVLCLLGAAGLGARGLMARRSRKRKAA